MENGQPRLARDSAFRLPPLQVLLVPAAITLCLWLTSPNPITLVQGVSGLALLIFPWWSYWRWRQSGFRGLPLFAGVSAMYWLYFSMQLFWGDRKAIDWRHPYRNVGEEGVTQAILLVLLGMIVMRATFGFKLGRRLTPRGLRTFSGDTLNGAYVQAVVLATTVAAYWDSIILMGGEGFRQVVYILEGTVSIAAFAILLQRALDGRASKFDKGFLTAIALIRAVLGLASGWVGGVVGLGMLCAIAYVRQKRKLPIFALAVIIPYVLFFQAGKNQFRHLFWVQQVEASKLEKFQFWLDASTQVWQQALNDPTGTGLRKLTYGALGRTSLLAQAANVLEQTPSVVPYQYGRLYTYLPISLIPRAIWADKPSVNDANQFYQLAYGITSERDLSHISIAVGALVEGFINFGWFGVVLVAFVLGVFLDFWNEALLVNGKNELAMGIGIAMLPQLVIVEYQLAQYASGIIQNVFLTALVFLPVIHWRRSGRAVAVTAGTVRVASAQS